MPAKPEPKTGFQTSEFIVAVLIITLTSLLLGLGRIGEPLWGEITKWVGSAYIVSRGLAK